MTIRRIGCLAGLVALASLVSLDAASARHRHRHRSVDRSPRQFVFQSPGSASVTLSAGQFAGYMLPGILGASTADPYARPGYGYYVGGGRGPGYFYDGQ